MAKYKDISIDTIDELSEPVKAIYHAILNLPEIDCDRLLMIYDKSTKSGAEYIGICYK